MSEHVAELTRDIEAAKRLYAPMRPGARRVLDISCNPSCKAPFIFTKAKQDPAVAVESLGHLRRYLETLLADG